MELNGKHIVISGATAGIGRSSALTLGQLGAELTLPNRHPAKAEPLGEGLLTAFRRCRVEAELGDEGLDALDDQSGCFFKVTWVSVWVSPQRSTVVSRSMVVLWGRPSAPIQLVCSRVMC